MAVSRQIAGAEPSRADARGRGFREAALQIATVIGPPTIFLVALETVYALTPIACQKKTWWPLPLTNSIAIALCVPLLLAALRMYHRYRTPDAAVDPSVSRACFLSAMGVLSGTLSILVILAMLIATLILDPCER